jgi:hypothetical protein
MEHSMNFLHAAIVAFVRTLPILLASAAACATASVVLQVVVFLCGVAIGEYYAQDLRNAGLRAAAATSSFIRRFV